STSLHVINFYGTRLAAALNWGNNSAHIASTFATLPTELRVQSPFRAALFVPVESLINLQYLAFAADWIGAVIFHGFANAMPNEPAGFEIDAENAAELVGAETLLAAAHQVHGLEPNVQRHMAFLKDGVDLDGERLPARPTFVDADPVALALQQ